jgi:hypothetical protein
MDADMSPSSRRETILDLWDAGLSSQAIASRVGFVSSSGVRAAVQRARFAGDDRARPRHTHRTLGAAFEAEAARRGVSPQKLNAMLWQRVTEDNLFTAVLDE